MKKQISQNTPLSQPFPQGEKGVATNVFFPSTRGGGIKGGGCKAFTLVELIVVITILAVLGTISFISLQSYSKDARDVKRISDVRSLLTKLNVEQSVGTSLEELITNTTERQGQILGIENTPFQTMGEVNFQNINEKQEDFQDPSNNKDYYFAYATGGTGSGGYNFIEGATISETQDTTKILGNYYTQEANDIPSLFTKDGESYYEEGENQIYDIDDENNNNEGDNNDEGGITPPLIIPSCNETTKPSGEGIEIIVGTPIEENQSWQNTDSNNACYYTCNTDYLWNEINKTCEKKMYTWEYSNYNSCSTNTPTLGVYGNCSATVPTLGSWGGCSVSCGGGTQTRNCAATNGTQTRTCTATTGNQTRTATCKLITQGLNQIVGDEYCNNEEGLVKETLTQTCNSGTSLCNTTGYETSRVCTSGTSLCGTAGYETTQSCNTQSCVPAQGGTLINGKYRLGRGASKYYRSGAVSACQNVGSGRYLPDINQLVDLCRAGGRTTLGLYTNDAYWSGTYLRNMMMSDCSTYTPGHDGTNYAVCAHD